MEEVIVEWLDALPPFVTRYYYCKKKFLKEVLYIYLLFVFL